MKMHRHRWLLLTTLVSLGIAINASGQTAESLALQRKQIMESPRWRQLEQSFDQWLSVQDLYSPEEIAQIKRNLHQQIQSMSPSALMDFMDESESRMHILLSDQATEARAWLNFLTPQARRRMVAPQGGKIPDVFNMSVAQLRQELNQFQQQRTSLSQAQAGFDRSRQQQVQQAQADQRAQQQAFAEARRQASPTFGSAVPPVSPYSPIQQRDLATRPWPPVYITPWGGVGRMWW